jgi:predicted nucleic acid-binding protein
MMHRLTVKIGTMMVAKAFVDTNVVLRSQNNEAPLHAQASELLADVITTGYEVWISRQVLREYLVWVTRPDFLTKPIKAADAETHLTKLRQVFKIADDTEAVTTKLLQLIKQYPTIGKPIHDANIVATMLVNSIDTLLTTNLKDFKRFETEITIKALIYTDA